MNYNIDSAISELKKLSIDTPNKLALPDKSLLDDYENKIGFIFTDDYKKFLLEASNVFVGILNPLVVTASSSAPGELAVVLSEARAAGIPRDWLPICEDNGDYYCLTNDGIINFWSHEGSSSESWPNLASWIKDVWIDES